MCVLLHHHSHLCAVFSCKQELRAFAANIATAVAFSTITLRCANSIRGFLAQSSRSQSLRHHHHHHFTTTTTTILVTLNRTPRSRLPSLLALVESLTCIATSLPTSLVTSMIYPSSHRFTSAHANRKNVCVCIGENVCLVVCVCVCVCVCVLGTQRSSLSSVERVRSFGGEV